MKLEEFLKILKYEVNDDHSINIKNIMYKDSAGGEIKHEFNIREVTKVIAYKDYEVVDVSYWLSGLSIHITSKKENQNEI